MSTNVEPEEAEAIHALAHEEGSEQELAAVVQRDFRKPQRFSSRELESCRRSLATELSSLDTTLRSLFKRHIRTEALELDEVQAEGLFDDLHPPFALAEFRIAGQPAWISWDIQSAVKAIELLLGSDGEPEIRRLSSIENHLLRDIFSSVVAAVTKSLHVEATKLAIVGSTVELSNWRDASADAEAHRLMVAIQLEGIGDASTFHLYLPGVNLTSAASDRAPASEALPTHLHSVGIELGAHLGCSEIPLNDLLSLELGDVIPLGTQLSEPLQILVEGFECGTAEMGIHNGNRAIRIIEVNPRLEDLA